MDGWPDGWMDGKNGWMNEWAVRVKNLRIPAN